MTRYLIMNPFLLPQKPVGFLPGARLAHSSCTHSIQAGSGFTYAPPHFVLVKVAVCTCFAKEEHMALKKAGGGSITWCPPHTGLKGIKVVRQANYVHQVHLEEEPGSRPLIRSRLSWARTGRSQYKAQGSEQQGGCSYSLSGENWRLANPERGQVRYVEETQGNSSKRWNCTQVLAACYRVHGL